MPITNFMIQTIHNSPGPICTRGWDFFPVDLNTSVGGDFIYCGYQEGTSNPVTGVNFISYGNAQTQPIDGWEWSNADLNAGAGGKFVYMYWSKAAGLPPITALTFLATHIAPAPVIEGYTQIGCDLNDGAGGDYIWAYSSTSAQPIWEEKKLFKRD